MHDIQYLSSSYENDFRACEQRRLRSACAYAQSDQSIRCPLIESLDTTEYMNEEQWPVYFAHAQDDRNLRILRMFEGTFCLTRPIQAVYKKKVFWQMQSVKSQIRPRIRAVWSGPILLWIY